MLGTLGSAQTRGSTLYPAGGLCPAGVDWLENV